MPNPTVYQTLVTEIKVTLANIQTRTLVLKAAGAASMLTSPLTSTTIILAPGVPYLIGEVTKTLIINTNIPIGINYLDSGGSTIMMQRIDNQLAFNGKLMNMLELISVSDATATVQVIYG